MRDTPIARLPRPGYEPRAIRIGRTIVQPTLDANLTYDDNIFATRTDREDDAIVTVTPRLKATRQTSGLDLEAEAHADFIRYASNTRENVNSFGASLGAVKALGKSQSFTTNLSFDRSFERRSDPEADFDRARSPALINLVTGEFRYRYQGARLGIMPAVTISQLDYLPAIDADRDTRTYRGALRGSIRIKDRMALFIEPFINRRDQRLRVDRSGVDRDTTTAGVLGGISFDLADRLQGDLGVGVFRANPDDPSLRSFTGIAASGSLVWHPRTRTAVSLDVFRGDVATVRAGAIGRIDTRIALAIDQEARHNLLLRASIGLRNIHYRGTINRDQRFLTGQAEASYLVSRRLALVVGTAYTRRDADVRDDKFNHWQTTVGVRLTY